MIQIEGGQGHSYRWKFKEESAQKDHLKCDQLPQNLMTLLNINSVVTAKSSAPNYQTGRCQKYLKTQKYLNDQNFILKNALLPLQYRISIQMLEACLHSCTHTFCENYTARFFQIFATKTIQRTYKNVHCNIIHINGIKIIQRLILHIQLYRTTGNLTRQKLY